MGLENENSTPWATDVFGQVCDEIEDVVTSPRNQLLQSLNIISRAPFGCKKPVDKSFELLKVKNLCSLPELNCIFKGDLHCQQVVGTHTEQIIDLVLVSDGQ